ncbi:methyl-accepting chemotaxis protein [Ruminiclostridium herbifermentans]|uniref:methyl-accepting chemotaxis protein n=1 Tax=Ruminiclostridium herbifermentans TaxID=2488810 RepID=UPI0024544A12|nr:methyl-accepting chemotaxis protein [Ruminiclostridium herbifermentans]
MDSYYTDIDNYIAEFIKDGITNEDEKAKINNLKALIEQERPLNDKVVKLALAGQSEQALDILNDEIRPIGVEVAKQISELLDYNVAVATETAISNSEQAQRSTIVMMLLVIMAILLSILLGIFISRIISNPIKKITSAAERLALGDINITKTVYQKDEIGQLAESMHKMANTIREQALVAERIADGDLTVEVNIKSEDDLLGKKLAQMVQSNNEVLSNIAYAADQVAAGSKQISDSSIALSQGATEQASSVEELTASLEEISSQTKLNAENANQANELAEIAKLNAIQGNSHMNSMLKAMEDINESSSNISKIIKVIDDIAFQTNMLALNAAVEAARAGQHGKGFAVVAEEVKNLAARSANAAKETTDMIESSIKKSEEGTKIAKETAEALDKIVNEIEKVANIVNDINIASNEQALGIEQINQGIMQVSQVVQTNSATSEESAAASEELSSQASAMQSMVAKFKLKNNTKNYAKFDDLSPEVLKMLDDMSGKRKASIGESNDNIEEKVTKNTKIVLSDNEFGKY